MGMMPQIDIYDRLIDYIDNRHTTNIQLVDFHEPNITNYMVDKVIVDEAVYQPYNL